MSYFAEVIKHSISLADFELVTFEVEYPHAVHKDIMTHRWARNFKSFRAVPTEILLEEIAQRPFRPEEFNGRVKGMGRGEAIREQAIANMLWDDHVAHSVSTAKKMMELKIAKEQVNFVLQDLCWIRGIITTTMPQLQNFFNLRLDVDENGDPRARKEVYKIASMMYGAYMDSTPGILANGEWHLPLVNDAEIMGPNAADEGATVNVDWDYWKKVSVGRCARVSYLTHDGVRDPEKDIALHDRLMGDGHMSPFEHQGKPIPEPWYDQTRTGCFGFGWQQYRKFIPGEAVYKSDAYGEPEGTYVIN
jgi:thymidylate synthase ThyX